MHRWTFLHQASLQDLSPVPDRWDLAADRGDLAADRGDRVATRQPHSRRVCLGTLAACLVSCLCLNHAHALAQQIQVSTLPSPSESVVRIHGSGTMQPLLEAWAVEFSRKHPDIKFELRPEGSLLAFAMLAEKTPAIGAMSRALLDNELAELTTLGVNKVWQVPVARDQIAVVTHPTCPVSSITMAQLKQLFSSGTDTPPQWNQLVPTDTTNHTPLVLVGPNELSGTRAAFERQVLGTGATLSNAMVSCDSHAQVLERVAQEPQGLGFLSAVWLDDNSHVLAIAADNDSPAQLPSNLSDGDAAATYPLERELLLVLSGSPDRKLTMAERAFLQFILSDEGLTVVQRTRFTPLSQARRDAARQQLTTMLNELQ